MQKQKRYIPWLWLVVLVTLISLAACRQRSLQEATPVTIPLSPGTDEQPLEIPTPLPNTEGDTAPADDTQPADAGYPAPTTEVVAPAGYPAPEAEASPTEGESAGEQPADAGAAQPTETPQDVTYIVQAGDTVGTIAQQFGVTIDDIARVNNLTNVNSIQIGDPLIIPLSGNIPATAPQERIHIVAAGETLFSIARFYSVDLNELASYNGITDPTLIYAGQQLRIPPPAATTP